MRAVVNAVRDYLRIRRAWRALRNRQFDTVTVDPRWSYQHRFQGTAGL